MIDISKLSSRYEVRALHDSDVDEVLAVCRENTLFYRYTDSRPEREHILRDMHTVPPDTELSQKHYIGFYSGKVLAAVMDIIDGFPEKDIAYIGFFMMNTAFQGRQIGSSIIGEVKEYLKNNGFRAARLVINKGNPQSTHFWTKNGFSVIREAEAGSLSVFEAECIL